MAEPTPTLPVTSPRSAAVPLAWLYAVLIVYGSLYPFAVDFSPSIPWLNFFTAGWPKQWTWFDVVGNFIGYIPFGFLVFLAGIRSNWSLWLAWLFSVLAGTGLSLGIELFQHFAPTRVPSNIDLLLNSAGTCVGATVSTLLKAMGVGQNWQGFRDRWFAPHSAGGIALLIVWPTSLLFPLAVPFGVGQVFEEIRELLLDGFTGTPYEDWAYSWMDNAESVVLLQPQTEFFAVLLGILAPGFLAYSIAHPGWRRIVLVTFGVSIGYGTATLSTTLSFGPQHALSWLTSPTLAGLITSWAVLMLMAWLPRRASAAMGLIALTALVMVLLEAPQDPYYALNLRQWERGQFIRFYGAAQWVSWLWPYAAMIYLLILNTGPSFKQKRAPFKPSLHSETEL
jgi:VanZ family protein